MKNSLAIVNQIFKKELKILRIAKKHLTKIESSKILVKYTPGR